MAAGWEAMIRIILSACHKQDPRAPGQRRWRSLEKGKGCGREVGWRENGRAKAGGGETR